MGTSETLSSAGRASTNLRPSEGTSPRGTLTEHQPNHPHWRRVRVPLDMSAGTSDRLEAEEPPHKPPQRLIERGLSEWKGSGEPNGIHSSGSLARLETDPS